MATRGGFSAWTERAKDVIVQELRRYVSLYYPNVLKEMPQIERYGLADQSSSESYVDIYTSMPQKLQRIPMIAVMSAPGTERKLNIGRQVIATFHDPDTGLPMVREAVGGNMTVVLQISAVDTNARSELTDIVFSFFTVYLEEKNFTILGDCTKDENGVPQLYQLIIRSTASIGGERDIPRPEGEPLSRIYLNSISVPIIFLDYVDREAYDISVCHNPFLEPEDDETRPKPIPMPEPGNMLFVFNDTFEEGTITDKWHIFANYDAILNIVDTQSIRGMYSLRYDSLGSATVGLVQKSYSPTSGKLRFRFRRSEQSPSVVVYCQLQGVNPLTDSNYHLVIGHPKYPNRLILIKGNFGDQEHIINFGSKIVIPYDVDLGAQLEWKVYKNRIRLRGYITKCDSEAYVDLVKRFEWEDSENPFLESHGVGVGVISYTPTDKPVFMDDIEIFQEIY